MSSQPLRDITRKLYPTHYIGAEAEILETSLPPAPASSTVKYDIKLTEYVMQLPSNAAIKTPQIKVNKSS